MSANPHIPYTILSQDFSEDLMPNGSFQDVWRITFQLGDGTISNVKVPAVQYSAATVDAAIQNVAIHMVNVSMLGPVSPVDLGLA